jgi:uncharacterized repeat protein (TIGR03847 family)
MSDDLQELGRVELLDAEAIGQPGNRRFRIYARSSRGTASLWVEREQLEALSLALDQLLAQVAGGMVLRAEVQVNRPVPPGAPADFPEEPDVEFQVGQMQIGYDEDTDLVTLRVAPLLLIEQEGELLATDDVEFVLSVTATRSQAERLSAHITDILAAGRPRCPFCGRPMQDGHVCEKQNGYHPIGLN